MTDYTNLRKIVTGDIIVKCRLGNDIRRIPINQVPTYDELCLMMYRVFRNEIQTPEDIVLKYMDNEGDMISLLDDIDITHAISISNLLKITIYDKSTVKHQTQLQVSLVEIRDSLNELIKSFGVENKKEGGQVIEKSTEVEEVKKTRRLTPAELASFLNDTKNKENSSVKELSILSSKNVSSSNPTSTIPYYPPPTSQPQVQQETKQHQHQIPQQLQQHNQMSQQQPGINHQQYNIQTPASIGQNQQQRPQSTNISQQYPPPPVPPQYTPTSSAPSYQLPPNNSNLTDPILQQQQQQQQQRPGYYVPPPPSSVNTPQPPYQPKTNWW